MLLVSKDVIFGFDYVFYSGRYVYGGYGCDCGCRCGCRCRCSIVVVVFVEWWLEVVMVVYAGVIVVFGRVCLQQGSHNRILMLPLTFP